jgi:hypothetical protein
MARRPMTMEQILSILHDTPERLSGSTGDLTEPKLQSRASEALSEERPLAHSTTHVPGPLRTKANEIGMVKIPNLARVPGTLSEAGVRSSACRSGQHQGTGRPDRSAPDDHRWWVADSARGARHSANVELADVDVLYTDNELWSAVFDPDRSQAVPDNCEAHGAWRVTNHGSAAATWPARIPGRPRA